MLFSSDVAVVFLPLLGAVVAGLFGKKIGDKAAQIVSCACILIPALLSISLFSQTALHGEVLDRVLFPWIQSGSLFVNWGIRIDTLTAVMLLVVNGVSSMVHIYSIGYMRHEKGKARFMAYMNLFTFFMGALVTAPNLLQMFFGWEGVGLMSYLLINFWYEKPSANTASMKAFLVNRVGDFGFLLGIFGCFVLFGSLDFDTIFSLSTDLGATEWTFLGCSLPVLSTISFLLFMGAMGKSAQLGFHVWLPDAMEGPTPVSALIHAATMVTAGVFMIARMSPLFEHAPGVLSFVAVIGALTCIFAASIGLTQFDIKRVIAYSTMSQLGYMFFAAGFSAYSASVFHLMTHAFFKALLFLCAGSVIHAMSGEQDMRKMGDLRRALPVTHVLMWIGSLSLMGVGIDGVFGFAGFYSKDLILNSALARGGVLGMFAYVMGLLAAFMTAFYSGRLLFLTFYGYPKDETRPEARIHEAPPIMLWPLIPLALGAVFAGFIADDWFAGSGREAFWSASLFVLPAHDASDALEQIPFFLRSLPVLMAFLGLGLSFFFYVVAPEMPAIVSTAFGGVYQFIYNKFYIDELYDKIFVTPMRALGDVLWKKADDAVIDGCGPNGLAFLSMRLAKRVGALESGLLYHYAFAMVLGVAGFISWFWLKG